VTVHREHKVKRENQQDTTNSMFIIKLLSQQVSGIIMPIIRRTRPCHTASSVQPVHVAHDAAPQDHSQPQPTHPGRTPHAVWHGLILLMMGIMMPETYWDRSLIINIELFASCWFSLFTLEITSFNWFPYDTSLFWTWSMESSCNARGVTQFLLQVIQYVPVRHSCLFQGSYYYYY